MASRREWWSPFFARVISRSSSGLTALALASVVWMRSWSITSRQRFMKSDLRCAASRESLPFCLRWRMAGEPYPGLACAEPQAASVEGLLDLLDRLAAEVRDRRQLGLGLLDEVAHRLDARALEAVVRAHAQLELLDQDVVHPTGARRTGAVARETVGPGDQGRTLVTQRLHAVGVGEDRQVLDQDLGGLAQRGLRVERAVGLDVQRELVVVGLLADARGVHGVGDALDRREDRVDRDHADRLVGGLVVLGRGVAAAVPDRQVHLELGLLLEGGDADLGVEDLDARGQ